MTYINFFEEVEDYGIEKIDFLSIFLYLPHGIPSHNTINRIFERICPLQFSKCLHNHSHHILEFVAKKQINIIDGKVLRGTRTSESKNSGLCIVSAWASEYHLTLGQVVVDKKSNEKMAIPTLLEELDLNNACDYRCNGYSSKYSRPYYDSSRRLHSSTLKKSKNFT